MAENVTSLRARSRDGIDLETGSAADRHQDLRLWLRMMTIHNLVKSEIRRRLRQEFGVTLPRFDLMATLERASEGIRVAELSKRLMVTSANTIAVTGPLERDGLVARAADPTSKRASLVRLTAEGRRVFALMAEAHERWVVEIFATLSESDKHLLFEIMGRHKKLLAGKLVAGRGR